MTNHPQQLHGMGDPRPHSESKDPSGKGQQPRQRTEWVGSLSFPLPVTSQICIYKEELEERWTATALHEMFDVISVYGNEATSSPVQQQPWRPQKAMEIIRCLLCRGNHCGLNLKWTLVVRQP